MQERSQRHGEDHGKHKTCFKLMKAKNIYHFTEDESKSAELSKAFSRLEFSVATIKATLRGNKEWGPSAYCKMVPGYRN